MSALLTGREEGKSGGIKRRDSGIGRRPYWWTALTLPCLISHRRKIHPLKFVVNHCSVNTNYLWFRGWEAGVMAHNVLMRATGNPWPVTEEECEPRSEKHSNRETNKRGSVMDAKHSRKAKWFCEVTRIMSIPPSWVMPAQQHSQHFIQIHSENTQLEIAAAVSISLPILVGMPKWEQKREGSLYMCSLGVCQKEKNIIVGSFVWFVQQHQKKKISEAHIWEKQIFLET